MTGKVIDSSANGILILILPIAFLIVLLFKAWPVLLALLIFSIIWQIWQQYQWQRWSQQVNPYFNDLIKENQGCLTPLDLSMKANLSASAAKRYLDRKAEEFGAQRQVYEDKGTVYYFLTASALGRIFDESEPLLEPEDESSNSQASQPLEAMTQTLSSSPQSTPQFNDHQEFSDYSETEESNATDSAFSTDEIEDALEPMPHPEPEQTAALEETEDVWAEPANDDEQEPQDSQSLIQAELAKRLDVHSSTVGKRKSDSDFSEWSQSRDPEGIAWEYSPETKEFLPVENKPPSEQ